MSENTGISWADHTFNPWWGCHKVSPACKHCYAADWAGRFGYGWGKDVPRRFFGEKHWREPLAWNAKAKKLGKPAFVFCASMADVFEERETISDETWAAMQDARTRLFDLVEATPWLVWLLLTKRPHLVGEMVPNAWMWGSWPPNAWVGATMENQRETDARCSHLLRLPAPRHFGSYEPALEAVDFSRHLEEWGPGVLADEIENGGVRRVVIHKLDWVIVGGESGPNARPFRVEWARDTIAQCRAAGASPFVKQMGARPSVGEGLGIHLRHPAGADPAEWPEALRVQERPAPLQVRDLQGVML